MYNPRSNGNNWRHRGPDRGHGARIGPRWRPNTYFNPTAPPSTNKSNEEHWCETCDRGFSTVQELDRHKQQHQKCNIDGCQFVAHPKVITKHIQMQHSSGLYKKISKLTNPEDIQKWREERKKKYPTRINIDKKAAEIKEKVERGEKMALKQRNRQNDYNSALNSQNTGQARGSKRKHTSDRNKQYNKGNNKSNVNHQQNLTTNKKPPKKVPKVVPNVPNVTEKNNLKPFAGILSIVMDDNEVDDVNTLDRSQPLIEDDYYENTVPCEEKLPDQEPLRCAALTLLMCDYGSSEDEANEVNKSNNAITENATHSDVKHLENVTKENIEQNNSCTNSKIKESIPNNPQKKYDDDNPENSDSGPEEVKCLNHVVDATLSQEINIKTKEAPTLNRRPVQPKNIQRQKYRHTVPSTLLHKLLHKEIRQERNIVLQCIRYIKRMNYFDKSLN